MNNIIGESHPSDGNFNGLESSTLKFVGTNNFHNSFKSCSFLADSFLVPGAAYKKLGDEPLISESISSSTFNNKFENKENNYRHYQQ